jgi:hypothetical protein
MYVAGQLLPFPSLPCAVPPASEDHVLVFLGAEHVDWFVVGGSLVCPFSLLLEELVAGGLVSLFLVGYLEREGRRMVREGRLHGMGWDGMG